MRVLIVGAGIAGLALARALLQRGIMAEVVERVSEWEPSGAGLYLPGNAGRALHELSMGSALAQRANPIRRQRLRDHRGRLLADIDVDRLWDGVGGCVALHRAALHEMLLEATADVHVRFGLSVTDLKDGEAPRVIFSDGSTGTYDLVVGADGIHSTIRSLALGGPAPGFVGQVSWRFIAEDVGGITDWTVMLGRGRAFLTVALGGGVVYCYADVNTSDPVTAAGEDWRGRFADFAEPVPSLLDRVHEAYFAPIEEIVPPAWTSRRVVLVGDAAHASSPNMAQGAAMALEDAVVLAETLTADQTVDRALAGYVRRRKARVTWVQEQTHRRDRTRSLPSIVRNLTLRLAAERIFRSNYGHLRDLP